MAERTAEGGVRLSLTLDKDGKPFVQSVNSAMQGATNAVTAAGRKSGQSFGELLTSGFVLRAAAATIVLRRLVDTAGEGSPEFRQLKTDVHEAAAAIGSDLQNAIASILTPAKPFLDWVQQASELTRGFLIGTVGAATALTPFKQALVSLGVPGGQAVAILTALGVAVGALAGKIAEKQAEVQKQFSDLVKAALEAGKDATQASREQLADELKQEQELLENRKKRLAELAEKSKTPQIDVTGQAKENDVRARLTIEKETNNLNASIAQSEEQVSKLRVSIRAYDEALTILSRGTVNVPIEQLPISDFLSALNVQIAAGETQLRAARDQVNARRDELQKDLEILSDTEKLAKPSNQPLFNKLKGGDAVEGAKLQAQATSDVKIQKQLIAAVEKDLNALLGAQLDLTSRIGDQNEKMRSTELNRKLLQAQLVDGLRGLGPVLEKQVLEEERRRLAIDEGGKAKTRILELDNQILGLSGQIADVEQKRAELAKQQSEAKWRQEVADFQTAYLQNIQAEIALQKLASESEQQFRQQRILSLSDELGLRNLSVQALRDELDTINAEAAIAPEMAADRRTRLIELIGLLDQERQAQAGISEELSIVTGGFRRLSDQGSLAIVQLFTRGKAEAKEFGDFVLQTFEQVLQALLSRMIVMGIIGLFTGGLGGLGRGGGGGGGSIMDFLPVTSVPRLGPQRTLPNLPSQSANQMASLSRLEAKLDSVASGLSNLKLHVAPFRLRGADLRSSVQIAEVNAPRLRTKS